MPLYEYRCECGGTKTEYKPLSEYNALVHCECGQIMGKVLSAPQVFIAQEVHYTCPITGEPITSQKAHQENLAKHGCREYDPEEKKDWLRARAAEDAALEENISETAMEFVETLLPEAREQLGRELESGLDCTVIRQ